jgi:hypothetical protein
MGSVLHDVELADRAPSPPVFLIESASQTSFISLVAVYLSFILLHVVSALMAPPLVASRSESYPLNSSNPSADMTLSFLDPRHRAITVSASVVRRAPLGSRSAFLVNLSTRAILSRNFTIMASTTQSRLVSIVFPAESPVSGAFDVFACNVTTFDAIELRVVLPVGFDCLQLRWSYCDPAARDYLRVALCLMSGLILYATAVYVRSPVRDLDSFTRGCCLAVGLLGVLACNPLSLFIGIRDKAIMALYVAVFRFFTLAQLLPPGRLRLAVLGIAVVALGTLKMEWFTLIAAACAAAAAVSAAGRRVAMFAGFVLIDVAARWAVVGGRAASEWFERSVLPDVIAAVVPITSGAFALFALRVGAAKAYRQIGETGDDVQQLSDELSPGNAA